MQALTAMTRAFRTTSRVVCSFPSARSFSTRCNLGELSGAAFIASPHRRRVVDLGAVATEPVVNALALELTPAAHAGPTAWLAEPRLAVGLLVESLRLRGRLAEGQVRLRRNLAG